MAARQTLIRWLPAALRLIVGGLFAYAGAVKARDMYGFAIDVRSLQLLGDTMSIAVARILPWIEIVCGVSLIFARCHRGAMAILLPLTSLFIALAGASWARGIQAPCGCFGGNEVFSSYGAILTRDAIILVALLILAMAYGGGPTTGTKAQEAMPKS